MVEKRAAIIGDDVARLKYVRRSLAKYEAAARRRSRFLRRSLAAHDAARHRLTRGLRVAAVALMLALAFVPRPPHAAVAVAPLAPAIPGAPHPAPASSAPLPNVWLVEAKPSFEIYSNGLRIDNQFLTRTRARAYRAFDRATWRPLALETQPAGIVFHTTESRMAPFDSRENTRLQRNGRDLAAYIVKNRFYHYLIDRFGRVFRVVAETDYANHAGNSVWADERRIYWNLNQSFLGAAIEAQTAVAGEPAAGDIATPAQIDAIRVLTEMLRSKYRIAAADCVTHAQVSINSDSMRLGYHTDWAANFPFRQVGLGGGYERPVAALTLFGFDYDSTFLRANGRQVWQGLVVSEEQLVRAAAAHGTTLSLYRRMLQHQFRVWKAGAGSAPAEESAGDRPSLD